MKKLNLRRVFIGILAVIFLGSAVYVLNKSREYKKEKKLYTDAVEKFVIQPEQSEKKPENVQTPSDLVPVDNKGENITAEDTHTERQEDTEEKIIEVDFDALLQVNSDIIGWLWIPNTDISYPLLQGASNDSYIHTAYTGAHASAGSIFMDYRNESDFSDKNTVIYGHNMKNDTMFGTLKKYSSAEYAQEHSVFYILTPEGCRKYSVCYAMVTDALGSVYNMKFESSDAYAEHLKMLSRSTYYDLMGEIDSDSSLVTLSTCTSATKTGRFVVIGKYEGFTLKDE